MAQPDGTAAEFSGGLPEWETARGRSWAGRSRRQLLQAWLLAGSVLLINGLLLSRPLGSTGSMLANPMGTLIYSAVTVIGMLLLAGLLLLCLVLAISRIEYCLPRPELLGGMPDSRYKWLLQRSSFLGALRLLAMLYLPPALLALLARSLAATADKPLAPLLFSLQCCGELLYIICAAALCAFMVLRLPRLAFVHKVLLALGALVLTAWLSVLITLLLVLAAALPASTPDYDLLLLQELCRLFARLLLLLGLLLVAMRQPAGELIEQLSEADSA
ncbi:MAG: hypothetical protein R3F46_05795 [bacterium]